MSEADLIYIAGFFDGEGSISLPKKTLRRGFNCSYAPSVTVTNTDLEVLTWLAKTTGIGKISPKPRSKNWKLCYQWVLVTGEMLSFLLALRPYLKVRKEQALLLIEFLQASTWHGPSNPLTEAEIVQKEVIFQLLEELNKRGA